MRMPSLGHRVATGGEQGTARLSPHSLHSSQAWMTDGLARGVPELGEPL